MPFSLADSQYWIKFGRPVYTTVGDVKLATAMPSSITDKDALIRRSIIEATQILDQQTSRRFMPYIDTKTFRYQHPYKLKLYFDFTKLFSVVVDDYEHIADIKYAPVNELLKHKPYRDIYINENETLRSFGYPTVGPDDAFTISGRWGYYHNEVNALVTLGSQVTDTTTRTITLDTDVTDYLHEAQMIRINDEYMFILDVDTTTLTVIRGFSGSTATTHDSGDTVKIISPIQTCQQACTVLAARIMARNDSQWSDSIGFENQAFIFVSNFPPEVQSFINMARDKEFKNLNHITIV